MKTEPVISVPVVTSKNEIGNIANFTPDQVAAGKRAESYHGNLVRAFADQMGYAFLAGLELTALKESVGHGQFLKAREALFPSIPHRSATQYISFSSKLGEIGNVANLTKEPSKLLTQGGLNDEQKAEVLKAVHDTADGKTLTQLYRDLGVIRDPKDPNAGEKKTPEQLTPEQQLQAWKERDTAVLQQAIDLMRSLITPDEERPRYFEKETRKAAQQLSIEFTKFLKRGPKEKKPSKAEQKSIAANEAARKAAEHKHKLAKVKAETGMDVETEHPEWPWFWGYKNRWGTIKLESFKGADDLRACNEARQSPSILVVIGAFQAETWSDGEKELARLIAVNPPLPGRVEEKPIKEKQSTWIAYRSAEGVINVREDTKLPPEEQRGPTKYQGPFNARGRDHAMEQARILFAPLKRLMTPAQKAEFKKSKKKGGK